MLPLLLLFSDAFIRALSQIFELVLYGLLMIIDNLSLPFTQAEIVRYANEIPDTVWWFTDLISLDYGVAIVFGSYLCRFILRRIPFIGG